MRTLSRDIVKQVGKTVTVAGWLHKQRKLGGLNFINIRDRGGLVQVLIEDKKEVEKIRGLQAGTILEVEGKVVKDERAPGGAEIHEPKIEVVVAVEDTPPIEIDKDINHESENLDTLFEYRPVSLRNLDEQAIFKLRAKLNQYLREYLVNNEFIEIQTPKLLAAATEGGAEVFKLDYYGKEATLAQSPQFYKQMMVGVFERVFEFGAAYRAEPSMTTRHLSETSMLDVEFGFIEKLDDVLKVAGDLIRYSVDKLWKEDKDLVEQLKLEKPLLPKELPQIPMSKVHKMYSEATGEDTTKELDLIPAEERWISEYALKEFKSDAIFVTEFPAADMKFYHRKNDENPEVADRSDLIFRGVELATVPMREHRYDVRLIQIKAAGIDPKHPGFKYYLMAFQYGLPPHGGFGFGIDRFTQKIIGLNNVKEATLFPRDVNRLAP